MRTPVKVAASATGVVLLAVGLGVAGVQAGKSGAPPSPSATRAFAPAASSKDPLDVAIAAAQVTLRARPADYQTWAELGVAYVQKAKISSDPSFYVKAEGAVAKSLAINEKDNYAGYAGQAALENARHDFRAAEASARKGIAINGFNAQLQGALADALTQLGRYGDAAAAVDRMNQLRPGVPAFTRASYVYELRGDVPSARDALNRALQSSSGPDDVAFVQYYLGELDLRYGGGGAAALQRYLAGLTASPNDMTLQAGRAKALVALGRTSEALRVYRDVVAAVPQPQFVLELAELEQSTGDPDASRQYALFRTEETLYSANGVALDTEQTLFDADHGTPGAALADAAKGWAVRPFVEMADAYGWAEYVNGHYREALAWSQRSFGSGWKPPEELFHRGMIEKSLGMQRQAKADLTEALRLDPTFNPLQAPTARKALAQLS